MRHTSFQTHVRRSFLAGSLLAALFVVPAFGGSLEDAQAKRDAGDWAAALPLYEQAVEEAPENVAALVGLSETYAGLGRFDEAAAVGTAALAEANPDLALARAYAYMMMADREAADPAGDKNKIYGFAADSERWTKVVLKADPNSARGLWLKAKRIQHQGNQEEALGILEAAHAAHPDNFELAWDIALHWWRAGVQDNENAEAWKKAWMHYEAARKADPSSIDALLQSVLARQWYLAKAPEEATAMGVRESIPADYEKVAIAKPGDIVPLRNMWNLFADKTAREAAYGRIRKANEGDANAWLYHAYAQKDVGSVDDAVKTFEEALGRWPTHTGLLKNLGDTYRDAGKREKAVAVYENLVKAWNGQYDARAYGALQKVYRAESLTTQQRERLWTALWQGVPSQPWAANDAGLWYRDIGRDYEKSLLWYERAAEQAPDDVAILNDTGLIHHFHFWDRAGSQKKAEDFYIRAIKAAIDQGVNQPSNVGYRDAVENLFKVYRRQKAWKKMKSFAEEHLGDDPRQGQWLTTAENG